MDIGFPTNVRHVAHVTFDRFNGFLGLPSEFEPDVPRKAPSASATVFGVSTQSMQLSYDSRGNCVPVVLLLLQSRLYDQGGLQAEGIFRITAENSEEEYVRNQLNKGVIPDGIDVHCLAGLIKAWFRELPRGILDPLPSEQVMQCESEDDFVKVVRLLPQTEASLLNWAINLMADVAEYEHVNKMNSRNIALVFAPNMSQMADPLTALMYAVQVMNLLKTLIEKTLREREIAPSQLDPSDDGNYDSPAEGGDCNEEQEANTFEDNEKEDSEDNYPDGETPTKENDEKDDISHYKTPVTNEAKPQNHSDGKDQKTARPSVYGKTEIERSSGSDSISKGNDTRKPHLWPAELPSPSKTCASRIQARGE